MFYRAFREVLLNLYRTPSLGTEASGHFRKVVVVERLKQEWMYGLSAKKKGRCRELEVAVSGGSTARRQG